MTHRTSDTSGSDAYPAEEPQAANDARPKVQPLAPRPDYTRVEPSHEPTPYNWVVVGKDQVLIHPTADHQLMLEMASHSHFSRPHAKGILHLFDRWDAEFELLSSNMKLDIVEKALKKAAKTYGWNYKGLIDEQGLPHLEKTGTLRSDHEAIHAEVREGRPDRRADGERSLEASVPELRASGGAPGGRDLPLPVVRRDGWLAADAGEPARGSGQERRLPRERVANRKILQRFPEATKAGWELVPLPGGHFRFVQNGHKVNVAATPSDYRSDRNAKAQLRKCERGDCNCRGEGVQPINPAAPAAQVTPDSEGVPQVGRVYRLNGVDYTVTEVEDPLAWLIDSSFNEVLYNFRMRQVEGRVRTAMPLPPSFAIKQTLNHFIAYSGQTAVGILSVAKGDQGQWVIGGVQVEPEYRRTGVASALLEEARRVFGAVEHDWGHMSPDAVAWSQTTAAGFGVGPNNPGVKDWRNKEWAGTDQFDQMPPPGWSIDGPDEGEPNGGAYECSECGEHFPDYGAWREHTVAEHTRADPLPSEVDPYVNMDATFPNNFVDYQRKQDQLGVVAGWTAVGMGRFNDEWYHVTDRSNLPVIQQSGILPARFQQDPSHTVEWVPRLTDHVYVFPHYETAAQWAGTMAINNKLNDPVIVKMQGLDPSRIQGDPEHFADILHHTRRPEDERDEWKQVAQEEDDYEPHELERGTHGWDEWYDPTHDIWDAVTQHGEVPPEELPGSSKDRVRIPEAIRLWPHLPEDLHESLRNYADPYPPEEDWHDEPRVPHDAGMTHRGPIHPSYVTDWDHGDWREQYGSQLPERIRRPKTAAPWAQEPDWSSIDRGETPKWQQYSEKPGWQMQFAEMMPISEVRRFAEFDRTGGDRINDDVSFARLRDHIAEHGINQPLMLEWSAADGHAYLGEGHHRLEMAESLGHTHVPVTVVRRMGPMAEFRDKIGRPAVHVGDYVGPERDVWGDPRPPELFPPSHIGLNGEPHA